MNRSLLALTPLFAALTTTIQAQWTVTLLTPAGTTNSVGSSLSGAQQVGFAYFDGNPHAGLWGGSAASWLDLNPPGATSSAAKGTAGSQQVGYAYFTKFAHAGLWRGTPGSWVDLNPAGTRVSYAYATSGAQQVGGADNHAALWSGTAASWVDLHPAQALTSSATAVSGGQQVGYANFAGTDHAGLWNGTSASWVDLNPTNAQASYVYGTSGTEQVGEAGFTDTPRTNPHAGLWRGTAASWVDLHPAGADLSSALGTSGTQQVGYAKIAGVYHAALWSGTAASWEDLSLALVGSWGDASANAIWSDGQQIFVTGAAVNKTTGQTEAILWSKAAIPGLPRLSVVPAGNNSITLSWTPATPGYVLQEIDSLLANNWQNSSSGTNNPVTVPMGSTPRWYRVHLP
jgi:hypothetical protein